MPDDRGFHQSPWTDWSLKAGLPSPKFAFGQQVELHFSDWEDCSGQVLIHRGFIVGLNHESMNSPILGRSHWVYKVRWTHIPLCEHLTYPHDEFVEEIELLPAPVSRSDSLHQPND